MINLYYQAKQDQYVDKYVFYLTEELNEDQIKYHVVEDEYWNQLLIEGDDEY